MNVQASRELTGNNQFIEPRPVPAAGARGPVQLSAWARRGSRGKDQTEPRGAGPGRGAGAGRRA